RSTSRAPLPRPLSAPSSASRPDSRRCSIPSRRSARRVSSYMKIALTPFLLVVALATGSASAQPVVNVYSSMAEKDLRQLVGEFERRHGVKVNLCRSGKNRILQRVISEARAGRHEVDVIHNPSPEMEALHREKLLRAVDSPLPAELIAQAIAPHREWCGSRVSLLVQTSNRRIVKRIE